MKSSAKKKAFPIVRENRRVFLILMTPFTLMFLGFRVFPVVWGIFMSFTNYSGFNIKNLKMVGWSNYVRVFTDTLAFQSFGRTVLIALIVVPITLYSNQPLTTPVSGDYFAKVQLDTHPQEMWKKALGRNWKFRNNIFYLTGPVSGEFDRDWAYADWQSNCFYGFPETAIPDDPTRITEDPQFVAPGEASFGFDSLSAYVLKTTSPCLNAGVPIGVRGVKDIFGNPIDASTGCNIGAYMGTGTDMQQSHNIALNTDVTASSAEGNSVYTRQTYMKNVTNGELDDLYLSGSELTENHTEWVEIDFGASFDVKSVAVYGAADGTLFPSRFKLLAWDGSEWKEVGSEKNFKREKTDSGQIQGTWTLEGVNTSKIRFEATSLQTNEDGEYRLALAEIQAFN